ncbi:hypothetical protein AOLI_G00081040 [Acnodon oligacanthus]
MCVGTPCDWWIRLCQPHPLATSYIKSSTQPCILHCQTFSEECAVLIGPAMVTLAALRRSLANSNLPLQATAEKSAVRQSSARTSPTSPLAVPDLNRNGTLVVVDKNKPQTSLGGLEPPTFRLTAERANRLRHRDNRKARISCVAGMGRLPVFGLVAARPPSGSDTLSLDTPDTQINTLQGPHATAEKSAVRQSSARTSPTSPLAVPDLNRNGVRTTRSICIRTLESRITQGPSCSVVDERRLGGSQENATRPDAEWQERKGNGREKRCSSVIRTHKPNLTFGSAGPQPERRTYNTFDLHSNIGVKDHSRTSWRGLTHACVSATLWAHFSPFLRHRTPRVGRDSGVVARLAQSVEHETLNLRVVGSSPTLGVTCASFIVGVKRLAVARSLFLQTLVVVDKNKPQTSLGGLEPPTFRLTAERANRLRHRDNRKARISCVAGMGRLPVFGLVAARPPSGSDTLSLDTPDTQINTLQGPHATAEKSAVRQSSARTSPTSPLAVPDLNRNGVRTTRSICIRTLESRITQGPSGSVVDERRLGGSQENATRPDAECQERKGNGREKRCSSVIRTHKPNLTFGSAGPQPERRTYNTFDLHSGQANIGVKDHSRTVWLRRSLANSNLPLQATAEKSAVRQSSARTSPTSPLAVPDLNRNGVRTTRSICIRTLESRITQGPSGSVVDERRLGGSQENATRPDAECQERKGNGREKRCSSVIRTHKPNLTFGSAGPQPERRTYNTFDLHSNIGVKDHSRTVWLRRSLANSNLPLQATAEKSAVRQSSARTSPTSPLAVPDLNRNGVRTTRSICIRTLESRITQGPSGSVVDERRLGGSQENATRPDAEWQERKGNGREKRCSSVIRTHKPNLTFGSAGPQPERRTYNTFDLHSNIGVKDHSRTVWVVGSSPTLGVTCASFIVGVKRLAVARSLFLQTLVVVDKNKPQTSLGGLEPPTFRLTAERANRLRHRDNRKARISCVAGMGRLPVFGLVATRPPPGSDTLSLDTPDTQINTLQGPHATAEKSAVRQSSARTSPTSPLAVPDLNRNGVRTTRSICIRAKRTLESRITQGPSGSVVDERRLGGSQENATRPDAECQERNGREKRCSSVIRTHKPNLTFGSAGPQPERRTYNTVVGSSPTLGVTCASFIVGVKRLAVARSLFLQTLVVVDKNKPQTSLGGLEPPTFRLTAERANRLRHRDNRKARISCVAGMGRLPVFGLVAARPPSGSDTLSLDTPDTQINTLQGPHATAEKSAVRQSSARTSPTSPLAVPDLNRNGVRTTRSICIRTLESRITQGPSCSVVDERRLGGSQENATRPDAEWQERKGNGREKRCSSVIRTHKPNLTFGSAGPQPERRTYNTFDLHSNIGVKDHSRTSWRGLTHACVSATLWAHFSPFLRHRTPRVGRDSGVVARLAQSVEHETLNLRVVGSSPTLGVTCASFIVGVKRLAVARSLFLQTLVVVDKNKPQTSLGGLEPPTFRLTAERANRLRHRDNRKARISCVAGMGRLPVFGLVAARPPSGSDTLSLDTPDTQINTLQGPHATAEKSAVRQSSARTSPTSPLAVPDLNRNGVRTTRSICIRTLESRITQGPSGSVVDERRLGGSQENATRPDAECQERKGNGREKRCSSVIRTHKPNLTFGSAGPQPERRTYNTFDLHSGQANIGVKDHSRTVWLRRSLANSNLPLQATAEKSAVRQSSARTSPTSPLAVPDLNRNGVRTTRSICIRTLESRITQGPSGSVVDERRLGGSQENATRPDAECQERKGNGREKRCSSVIRTHKPNLTFGNAGPQPERRTYNTFDLHSGQANIGVKDHSRTVWLRRSLANSNLPLQATAEKSAVRQSSARTSPTSPLAVPDLNRNGVRTTRSICIRTLESRITQGPSGSVVDERRLGGSQENATRPDAECQERKGNGREKRCSSVIRTHKPNLTFGNAGPQPERRTYNTFDLHSGQANIGVKDHSRTVWLRRSLANSNLPLQATAEKSAVRQSSARTSPTSPLAVPDLNRNGVRTTRSICIRTLESRITQGPSGSVVDERRLGGSQENATRPDAECQERKGNGREKRCSSVIRTHKPNLTFGSAGPQPERRTYNTFDLHSNIGVKDHSRTVWVVGSSPTLGVTCASFIVGVKRLAVARSLFLQTLVVVDKNKPQTSLGGLEPPTFRLTAERANRLRHRDNRKARISCVAGMGRLPVFGLVATRPPPGSETLSLDTPDTQINTLQGPHATAEKSAVRQSSARTSPTSPLAVPDLNRNGVRTTRSICIRTLESRITQGPSGSVVDERRLGGSQENATRPDAECQERKGNGREKRCSSVIRTHKPNLTFGSAGPQPERRTYNTFDLHSNIGVKDHSRTVWVVGSSPTLGVTCASFIVGVKRLAVARSLFLQTLVVVDKNKPQTSLGGLEPPTFRLTAERANRLRHRDNRKARISCVAGMGRLPVFGLVATRPPPGSETLSLDTPDTQINTLQGPHATAEKSAVRQSSARTSPTSPLAVPDLNRNGVRTTRSICIRTLESRITQGPSGSVVDERRLGGSQENATRPDAEWQERKGNGREKRCSSVIRTHKPNLTFGSAGPQPERRTYNTFDLHSNIGVKDHSRTVWLRRSLANSNLPLQATAEKSAVRQSSARTSPTSPLAVPDLNRNGVRTTRSICIRTLESRITQGPSGSVVDERRLGGSQENATRPDAEWQERKGRDCGVVARLAQSVEHETLNLRVVGSSPTLGVTCASFIVGVKRLAVARSLFLQTLVVVDKNKPQTSLGGLEPPTFRLTAERANRLRHRDNRKARISCVAGMGRLPVFGLVATRPPPGSETLSLDTPDTQINTLQGPHATAEKSAVRQSSARTSPTSPLAVPDLNRNGVRTTRSICIRTLESRITQGPSGSVVDERRLGGSQENATRPDAECQERKGNGREKRCSSVIRTHKPNLTFGSAGPQPERRTYNTFDLHSNIGVKDHSRTESWRGLTHACVSATLWAHFSPFLRHRTPRVGRDSGVVARLAQSVEHETLNLRVVGSSPTLGVTCASFIVGVKRLAVARSLFLQTLVVVDKNKPQTSLGGLEPPTFRLTAERANRLRHRDNRKARISCVAGMGRLPVFGLVATRPPPGSETLSLDTPDTQINTLQGPHVATLTSELQSASAGNGREKRCSSVIRTHKPNLTFGSAGPQPERPVCFVSHESWRGLTHACVSATLWAHFSPFLRHRTPRVGRDSGVVARLAQSVEHETLNLRVVGSSPTLGVTCASFIVGVKRLAVARSLFLQTLVVVDKNKPQTSLGGLEPPTFRLTAERANRLRHRDNRKARISCVAGMGRLPVFGLVATRPPPGSETLSLDTPDTQINTLQGPHATAEKSAVRQSSARTSPTSPLAVPDLNRNGVRTTRSICIRTLESRITQGPSGSVVDERRLGGSQENATRPDAEWQERKGNGREKRCSSVIRTHKPNLTFGSAGPQPERRTYNTFDLHSNIGVKDHSRTVWVVGSSPTLGVTCASFIVGVKRLAVARSLFLQTLVVVDKNKPQTSLGGLDPPTFRLTAERANRLRHRDNRKARISCVAGMGRLPVFGLVATRPPPGSETLSLDTPDTQINTLQGPHATAEKSAVRQSSARTSPTSPLAVPDLNRNGVRTTRSICIRTLESRITQGPSGSVVDERRLGGSQENATRPDAECQERKVPAPPYSNPASVPGTSLRRHRLQRCCPPALHWDSNNPAQQPQK